MNIILCGPPLAGKTTYGKMTAENLGWQFIDTDRLIEKHFSKEACGYSASCRQIYRTVGETKFRLYERQVVASLRNIQKAVIALGGGCLNDLENIRVLKKLGILLYLKTPFKVLEERLNLKQLPAFLENESNPIKAFRILLEDRCPIFEKYADRIVETENDDCIISKICGS